MSDLGALSFFLLGPLEARLDGALISLPGRKPRTLLTFLLLHENEVVSVDLIVDALWVEEPPETARGALQVYVSQLRKVLEPGHTKNDPYRRLLTEATGYRLQLGPDDELDLRYFERLFEQGRGALAEGSPAQASAQFAEALSLWRGPPLADFAYEQFAQGEIARLEELRLACLEERMEAELALGHHIELVGELDSLVRANPLRERLRAQLMLALYRCGRQADALEVYQQARTALVEELGIEPSTELQALNRAILTQEEAIAAPARIERPVQLPTPATPLVGRVRELAEVTALLAGETRLLTLTGPGGVGKTRLATAAAVDAEGFPDGKVWIDLQALRDPELVAPAIAQALGGQGEVGALIGERQILLCLDNLEQLLPAIAPELGRLLETAPHLSLIATSREPLRLSGEHEYPLGPLREADAAALFFQRARAVRPDFDETDEVGAICRRLDGLPLALELAAARVKLLTPEMILGRLEHRLQLLTGGARDTPERHQTLRATIDWSYDLLNKEERGSFARLSVFAGGFTLEAAEEVCETELDTLASLLDKSLIRAQGGRFSMLEAIREYAVDCMEASGEAGALRDAHAEWCLRLAEGASSALRDDEAPTWFRALAREHDNFRAALAWTKVTGDLDLGPRLAVALAEFWSTHSYLREGREWLEFWLDRGESLAVDWRTRALREVSGFAARLGDLEGAETHACNQLALARQTQDVAGIVQALERLVQVAAEHGDVSKAMALQEEASQLARDSGDKTALLWVLSSGGNLDLIAGAYDRARLAFAECLELARGMDIRREHLAVTAFNVGLTEVLCDDHLAAAPFIEEALGLYVDHEDLEGVAYCSTVLGAIEVSTGEVLAAVRLLGATASLLEHVGCTLDSLARSIFERAEKETTELLAADDFEAMWAEGSKLSPHEATDYARERCSRLTAAAGSRTTDGFAEEGSDLRFVASRGEAARERHGRPASSV